MFFLDYIWIVPLLPLTGAAIMFFFGRSWGSKYRPGAAHHDDAGPSPADTAYDVHAAHGPADPHPHPPAHHAPDKLPHSVVNAFCVGLIVIAFVWSCLAVWQYTGWSQQNGGKPYEKVLYTWLGSDTGNLNYATYDGRSAEF